MMYQRPRPAPQVRSGMILLALLCAACPPAADRRDEHAAGPSLAVQVDALTPGAAAPRPVMPGDRVHNGDGVALTLWTARRAYTYVVDFSPTGWSTLLWPQAAEQPQREAERVHVPPSGERLTVAGPAGEEVIYVLASQSPILKVLPAFCARFRLPCPENGLLRGDNDPPPPPPPPPVGTDTRDRGPQDQDGAVVRVKADPTGVAVARFSFHRSP